MTRMFCLLHSSEDFHGFMVKQLSAKRQVQISSAEFWPEKCLGSVQVVHKAKLFFTNTLYTNG